MSTKSEMEISVIIPVFNESGNLPPLFAEIDQLKAKMPSGFEVIFVDDCSEDDSRKILDQKAKASDFIKVLSAKSNMGMGGAIMLGAQKSEGKNIFWAMADLSDRLSDIFSIYEKLRSGYDLVIASRAMPGGSYGGLLGWKSFLSHSYSRVASLWFGIPVHDLTNAFRGMKRELLFKLKLKSRDFTLSPEMSIKAHRIGARISEIPTIYRYRRAGVSSFKVLKMGYKYASLLSLRFYPAPKSSQEGDL